MTTCSHTKSMLVAALCSALVLGATTTADAGRGGSHSRIQNAIRTGSAEAIIAEIERAEYLICNSRCIATVMALLDDERYEVREVAAWWFARRPAQMKELTERATAYLYGRDSIKARNAADTLGSFRQPASVPALAQAALRSDLSAEARQHALRALGSIGVKTGTPAIQSALGDSDVGVRLEALRAWNAISGQRGAAPVVALCTDANVEVRRKAAAVVGKWREASARTALEARLAEDDDAVVRRNAAWALGQIGDAASRSVLEAATRDRSPLVRSTAKVALRGLR